MGWLFCLLPVTEAHPTGRDDTWERAPPESRSREARIAPEGPAPREHGHRGRARQHERSFRGWAESGPLGYAGEWEVRREYAQIYGRGGQRAVLLVGPWRTGPPRGCSAGWCSSRH